MFARFNRLIGLFCLVLFQSVLSHAQSPVIFNHFTVEDGLSSSSVLSVTQDQKGFIWVGTMDGLNRYDGTKVKVFRSFYSNNPIGPNIIISQLLADKQQHVWMGTNNGLYVYNIQTGFFHVFYHYAHQNSITNNAITSLYLDSKGNVWVGTKNGLNRIVRTKDSLFQPYPVIYNTHSPGFDNIKAICETGTGNILIGTSSGMILLSCNGDRTAVTIKDTVLKGYVITSITEDKQNNIWAGTDGSGLFKISKNFSNIKQYRHQTDRPGPISNIIRKVITDKKGRIWIGTLKGLTVFNPTSGAFKNYIRDPNDEYSLNFNSIYDIYEDHQGTIWISTFFGGLNIVEAHTTPFKIYQNNENPNSISSNIISPIIEDQHKNLWIGTEAEGLNYFDRRSDSFKHFKSDESKKKSLKSNLVKALVMDHENNIWVAMHGGGITIIDSSGKKIKQFNATNTPNAINSNDVARLLRDDKNRIWIGTEINGINIYDFKTDKIKKFETIYHKALPHNSIRYLFEDSKQNIWIGTGEGLSMLSSDGRVLKNYFKKDYPGQLRSDYITCILEDKKGILWIGTYSGLTYLDPLRLKFGTYTVSDGLAGNKVVGVVADNHSNLWISTNNGLCRLDSSRTKFNTFTIYDGLPGDVFNYNSFFKDDKGHLFFGGYKGMIEFDPDEIELNTAAPVIMLTGLNINGHAVNTGDQSGILAHDISETKEVTLKYNQNVFSIDYAIMNFIKPKKNRAAYKLEGYNKNWVTTNERSASFTNLGEGNYTLLIKASNNDGVWTNTPLALKISVLPPPWKTWWAYTLYTVGICLLIFGVGYFFISRSALKRKLQYEHMVNVKQEELHRMKIDFFTHISHEIRTPLTLIMGPVEMLMDSSPLKSANHKLLLIVKSNAERLLKLTNDLLDFRKADSGHTHLKIVPKNIVCFAQSVYAKFSETANKKSIIYQFESEEKNIEVYFDPDHLEIVFSNLLSNAIKFTPTKGKVTLRVAKMGQDRIEIRVCDNGTGIPAESQDKIFTNFYQADAGGIKNTGSGIGLAFSKRLVELHQGELNFYSNVDTETASRETCFIVILKLGMEHFNPEDIYLD